MVEKIEIICEKLESLGLNIEVFKAQQFKYYQSLLLVTSEELIDGIEYALDNDISLVTERGTFEPRNLIFAVEESLSKGMVV